MLRRRQVQVAAVMGGGAQAYWERVLNTQAANLIGFWRLNEASGAVAADSSPEGNNGSYSNVTLANTTGPDSVLIAKFVPASNSYVNIYSAGFNGDFSGNEGTLMLWAKVAAASVWTDSTLRHLIDIRSGTQVVYIQRATTNNQLVWGRNATSSSSVTKSDASTTAWFHAAMTWSDTADEFKGFFNGSQVGTTQTGLGTWSGALGSALCTIGSYSTTPQRVWDGWEGLVAIWNTPLTPTQIGLLANP